MAICERIDIASPALRPLPLRQSDHAKHVSPTGSYFLAKPTHDCDIPIPISDTKSRLAGRVGWWIVRKNRILFWVRSDAAPRSLFLRKKPALCARSVSMVSVSIFPERRAPAMSASASQACFPRQHYRYEARRNLSILYSCEYLRILANTCEYV